MSKDDFKYLSQELDNNILDLVKHNGFYPKKFKKELASKEKFYISLIGREII